MRHAEGLAHGFLVQRTLASDTLADGLQGWLGRCRWWRPRQTRGLVKLAITAQGEEPFSVGGSSRKAMHYVVKVEIGGAVGLVAALLGKEPPDTHVWILGGEAPAFVKSEGPLYFGGPIWRIELVSPVWPRVAAVD